jgi:hypothetical protein
VEHKVVAVALRWTSWQEETKCAVAIAIAFAKPSGVMPDHCPEVALDDGAGVRVAGLLGSLLVHSFEPSASRLCAAYASMLVGPQQTARYVGRSAAF